MVISSNIFPSTIKLDELPTAYVYRIENMSHNERYKNLDYAKKKFHEKTQSYCQGFSEEDHDYMISFTQLNNALCIENLVFIPEKKSSFAELPAVFHKMLHSLARSQLEKNGLWRAYDTMYFNYNYELLSGNFRIHHGLSYRFDIVGNYVLLSVDPQIKIVDNRSLWEIIQKEGIKGGKTYTKSKFIAEKFRYQKSVCSIIKIDDSLTVSDKISMNGKKMSVLDYWQRNSPQVASKISENECLVQVKYGENSRVYSFAPSLLHRTLDVQSIPSQIRYILYPNPQSRHDLILKLLKHLNPLCTNDFKISFDERDILSTSPHKVFEPPTLVFGNGRSAPRIEELYLGLKTKKLKELGPEHPILVYRIIPMIVPKDFPKRDAIELYDEIRNQAKDHLMIDLPPDTTVWNYSSHPSEISENLDEFGEKIAGAIVIIHPSVQDIYYDFKRMFGDIPTQMFISDTVKHVHSSRSGNKGVYKNKIFVGTLGLMVKMGCRPWILDSSLNFDFNIGIDVGGRSGNVVCYSYVFDRSGKYLGIGLYEAQKKESIESSNIESAFVSIIKKKAGSQTSSIAIYRDGYLTKSEIKGLKGAIKRLVDESVLTQDCVIIGVNIRKFTPFRFFGRYDNQIVDCDVGTFYELDEKRGVVATTGRNMIMQGMSRPLLVEKISLMGDIKMTKVLQDVYYMSNLNWGSPNSASRMPAPLKYADEQIGLVVKGVGTSILPI